MGMGTNVCSVQLGYISNIKNTQHASIRTDILNIVNFLVLHSGNRHTYFEQTYFEKKNLFDKDCDQEMLDVCILPLSS